jgi:hypothetical protein
MLKSSALYIVIIIALVMAVICSSLIAAAYFYRLQYQKTFRYNQLKDNLESGTNILLESTKDLSTFKKISLFGIENDTVLLKREPWGIYSLGVVEAFIHQDTLVKAFSIGSQIDSTQWSSLYIIDEDRNISVSGKTSIKGTVYIPKAGIKEAYVNNQAYQGDKRLVAGNKNTSKRTLPELDNKLLLQLEQQYKATAYSNDSIIIKQDSVKQSFLKRTLTFDFGKQEYTISNLLEGNITLRSDTLITIESSASLKNVLIFAKAIKVKNGFKGNCQLFATDSIEIENNCLFTYPSVLAVLNFAAKAQGQRKLTLGEHTSFNGTITTYEKTKNDLLPVINLGKAVNVTGQVYSQGLLNYQDGTVINGSVHASRFLYQTAYTRYENYLINIKLDGPALSPYYLPGQLIPVVSKFKKVLQWLP